MQHTAPTNAPVNSPSPPEASPSSDTGGEHTGGEQLHSDAAHEAGKVLVRAAITARQNEVKRTATGPAPAVDVNWAERVKRLAETAPVAEFDVERDRAEAEKRRAAVRVALLQAANIPPRYAAAELGDWRDLWSELTERPDGSGQVWPLRRLYGEKVQKLSVLLERPGMIALIGRRGPGKTHMACALVGAFCQACRSAVYIDAMDFFIELQETYDDSNRRSQSMVESKYLRPELLVLDAMEERADTAWNDRMLVRLIDKRYKAEKSTVLISNEDEPAFNARVGPSIADRIRDDGGKIVCDWPSLRGRLPRNT